MRDLRGGELYSKSVDPVNSRNTIIEGSTAIGSKTRPETP